MNRKMSVIIMLLIYMFVGMVQGRDQHIIKRNFMMPEYIPHDSGYEFEYQYRHWDSERSGYAISLGSGGYNLSPINTEIQTGYVSRHSSVDASVSTLPVGILGLIRVGEPSKDLLILSYGIKYTFVNARGGITQSTTVGRGPERLDYASIEVENPLSWEVCLEYQRKVQEHVNMLVGVGYRQDIESSKVTAGPYSYVFRYDALFVSTGLALIF